MCFCLLVGDEFSACFLIKSGALVNAASHVEKETSLHIVANYNPSVTTAEIMQGMVKVCQMLLQHGANPDQQDSKGKYVWFVVFVCLFVCLQ